MATTRRRKTDPTIEPRKRPRQERSQEMVERILATALELAGELGFKGLTTARIAQRAGLSVGSLYQYFPNKEAIVLELARRWLERFRALLERHSGGPGASTWRSFVPALRSLLRDAAVIYRESTDLLSVLAMMTSNQKLRRIDREHDEAIVAGLARWFRRINPRLPEDVGRRLGRVLLGASHACLVDAAECNGALAARIEEDLETMAIALLREHLAPRAAR